jgi:hypothetical protein
MVIHARLAKMLRKSACSLKFLLKHRCEDGRSKRFWELIRKITEDGDEKGTSMWHYNSLLIAAADKRVESSTEEKDEKVRSIKVKIINGLWDVVKDTVLN